MDWNIFERVNHVAMHTGWAHPLFEAFADLGIVLFAAVLVVVALRTFGSDARTCARAIWTAIAAMIALALNQPIASWVNRTRPYTAHPHILTLVERGTDPSFMSDHSIVAVAVAAGLFVVARKVGIVAIAAALLMAFTRVYVGAHYPSDVIAGLLFGAVVALAGMPLADKFLVPIVEWAQATKPGRRFIGR